MKKKNYDWNAIKTEYVTGDITVSALAKKYGINSATVYRHYQIERWNELKKDYLENVMEKCADNAAYIAAIKLAKEIDIANKLSGVLDEAASDKKQFQRHLVKGKDEDGKPVTEEVIFEKVDMESLNNAIKALKSLEEIKRVMYGIISPLEERKLGIKNAEINKTGNEENETGIVMLPEIKEEDDEA